ncbi:MAG: hypothetical protein KAX65_04690 [Caldilineaceae bacterium]|nr:hypothetical protein [Caldilineaceae bacterium]
MPPPIAPSEVHINEDIRNTMRALLATHESARRMMPDSERMIAYTEGFTAAFRLLAEALNIHLGR